MNILLLRPDPWPTPIRCSRRGREPSKIIIFYARPKFHDFSTRGRARSSQTPFSFERKKIHIFPNYYLTIPAPFEPLEEVTRELLSENLDERSPRGGCEILAVINANDLV